MREDVSYWILKLTGWDEWINKGYSPEYLKIPSSISYDELFKVIYNIILSYKNEMIRDGFFHRLSFMTMNQVVFLLSKTYNYEILDKKKFSETEDDYNNRIKIFNLRFFRYLDSRIKDGLLTYDDMLYRNTIRYNRYNSIGEIFSLHKQDEKVNANIFEGLEILKNKDMLTNILDKSITRPLKRQVNLLVLSKNKIEKNQECIFDSEYKVIYGSMNFLSGIVNETYNMKYVVEDLLYIYYYNFPDKRNDVSIESLSYLMEKLCNMSIIDSSKKLDEQILKSPNKKILYLDLDNLNRKVSTFKNKEYSRGCYFGKNDDDVITEIKVFHGYE